MAGKKLGTIFVELGLDSTEFTKGEAKILQQAQSTSLKMEQNWRTLGSHSDTIFNAMKANIINAYDAIANNAKSTATEIIRAEEAKNQKIKALSDQQFGEQKSGLDSLKGHYLAITAAIAVSIGAISKAWSMAKAGADFDEQRGILDNLSRKYNSSADSIVESMRRASDGLVANSDLMQVALGGIAKGLNPEQLTNLADAARILGDAVGKDATTALKELTDALESGRTKGLKTYLGTALDLETAFGGLESKMTAAEKAQAMYNMTMISAATLQAQQTKAVDDTADKFERMEASYKNATTTVSIWAKTAVAAIYDVFAAMNKNRSRSVADSNAIPSAPGVPADTAPTETKTNPYQAEIDGLKKLLEVRKTDKELSTEASQAKKKALDNEIIYIKQITDAEDQRNKDQVEFDEWFNKDAAVKTKATYDSQILEIKQVSAAEDEWNKARKEFADWENDEGKKTVDRLQAERDIYSDLRGYETSYFDASIKLIQSQAEAYKKKGVDVVAIEAWVTQETIKADMRKAESGDDFFAGIEAGYKKMKQDALTFGKAGVQVFQEFADSSKTAISDTLFQAIKDGTVDIKTIWETMTDTMLRKFTDICGQMVAEAIANPVKMTFDAVWSATGAVVIGQIGKLINYLWDYDIGSIGGNYAYGGRIPGQASGGDSYSNDTVHAMLSPGEYVVPRSAVNSQTLPVLEYMRENKRMPGYADGGLVSITNTDPTLANPLDPYTLSDAIIQESMAKGRAMAETNGTANSTLDRAAQDYVDDGRYLADYNAALAQWNYAQMTQSHSGEQENTFTNPINPYLIGSGNIGDGLYSMMWRDGQITQSEADTDHSWFGPTLGAILKAGTLALFTYVGGVMGGPIGAAAGAGITQGMTAYSTGASGSEALISAAIAAAMAYYAAGSEAGKGLFGGLNGLDGAYNSSVIVADMAGNAASNAAVGAGAGASAVDAAYQSAYTTAFYEQLIASGSGQALLKSAYDTGSKWLLKSALGWVKASLAGGGVDDLGLEYAGVEGDLGWLYKDLGMVAPGSDSVSFPIASARDGIDYIKRDNTLVNTHKGEAVITAEENASRRSGGGLSIGILKVFVGNTEIKDIARVEADGVIVARNRRGVNPLQTVYA